VFEEAAAAKGKTDRLDVLRGRSESRWNRGAELAIEVRPQRRIYLHRELYRVAVGKRLKRHRYWIRPPVLRRIKWSVRISPEIESHVCRNGAWVLGGALTEVLKLGQRGHIELDVGGKHFV